MNQTELLELFLIVSMFIYDIPVHSPQKGERHKFHIYIYEYKYTYIIYICCFCWTFFCLPAKSSPTPTTCALRCVRQSCKKTTHAPRLVALPWLWKQRWNRGSATVPRMKSSTMTFPNRMRIPVPRAGRIFSPTDKYFLMKFRGVPMGLCFWRKSVRSCEVSPWNLTNIRFLNWLFFIGHHYTRLNKPTKHTPQKRRQRFWEASALQMKLHWV